MSYKYGKGSRLPQSVIDSIIRLKTRGLTAKEVAGELGVGVRTVYAYTNPQCHVAQVKAPQPRRTYQARTCLRCGEPFRSWGPANRICDGCAERNEIVRNTHHDYQPYAIGWL
jgi:hypothetical protein